MLVSLEIRNFLLIKKLSINLIKGFNTFTGETGAGKSIIIDALKLALGGKNNSNHNLKDNEINDSLVSLERAKKQDYVPPKTKQNLTLKMKRTK